MSDYENVLANLRGEINSIDDQLIQLLCERYKATLEVGKIKTENWLSIKDEQREAFIFERTGNVAKHKGLEPEIAKQIFQLICKLSCEMNSKLKD